jgi:hypothetical protein
MAVGSRWRIESLNSDAASLKKGHWRHGDTRLATAPDGPARTISQSQKRPFRPLSLIRGRFVRPFVAERLTTLRSLPFEPVLRARTLSAAIRLVRHRLPRCSKCRTRQTRPHPKRARTEACLAGQAGKVGDLITKIADVISQLLTKTIPSVRASAGFHASTARNHGRPRGSQVRSKAAAHATRNSRAARLPL